ncbi:hypothetical protein VTI28DRAFT_4914 [Corynascus sepedonium]
MAQKYAKDQPEGFTNRIERVAIVGAGGQLGQHIVKALVQTGRHTVTALTRVGSKNKLPEGVVAAPVDYADESSLEAALKGQQFLIITLAVTAPQGTHSALVRAAARAGVAYVMPNAYGFDPNDEALARDDVLGSTADGRRWCEEIESLGVSAWIALTCGFWYEYSLVAVSPIALGLDHDRKTITLYDEGETRVNLTTFEQCARAVAALVSLKELPDDEDDAAPAVSRWRNKPLYIASFTLNQREMLESWERVTGEKWTVEKEPVKERYRRGIEAMQAAGGDPLAARMGAALASFARAFYPEGGANYESTRGLANDLLGLPKEDLDARTRAAKQMLDDGYATWVFGRLQNS